MYNWSVHTPRLKKNPRAYNTFVLEQRINFGLNGKKLSRSLLKKYWNELVIDPHKRTFLEKIIWTQPSL
ncbi:MAG TPA: hypothetical protein DIU47_03955 [Candidatus Pacebacteria bacterium]|nr:MAG: hypothetical protein UX00_C0001G0035 [Microgenomates group bacterium GW2011_GWB1_45_17]KKU24227.1 MAG: hypothetical protein UX36_C0002G0210 [Microgenomates group bacterium GW2011_GWC1_46_15]KKU24943.1 MAG: hypothetical protein UX35_C0001G0125 [Microgenomates group bacterium GW2011_GWA1_46_15]HCR93079.1 hypothetical protein [Candidatus Paceibacterota bacterium]